jgi:hypothetical protein
MALTQRLGRAWCRTMHKRALWPIHGEYECATCFRRYTVPWEMEARDAKPKPRNRKNNSLANFSAHS